MLPIAHLAENLMAERLQGVNGTDPGLAHRVRAVRALKPIGHEVLCEV